jgi:ABC-type lipoprotein export system ATPase subunit
VPHAIAIEQKKRYARSLLTVLDLKKQAHMVIGNNTLDGISADQRKRVTMGVEMAADPAILFLDDEVRSTSLCPILFCAVYGRHHRRHSRRLCASHTT